MVPVVFGCTTAALCLADLCVTRQQAVNMMLFCIYCFHLLPHYLGSVHLHRWLWLMFQKVQLCSCMCKILTGLASIS